MWNVLDWSAATVPVLRAHPSKDPVDEEYHSRNVIDEYAWKEYNPKTYEGGPVSVQIIGRKMEEEKVLKICEVVESALKDVGVNYEEVFGAT